MAIKKLADLKKKVSDTTGSSGDGESPFVSLKDGEKKRIRVLQEFDDDSALYDERRGTIKVIDEHNSPKDFKKSAMCTAETEGRCWACEQTQTGSDIAKKWKPKMRFYANVLVRGVDGASDKVKILKQGFSDNHVGNNLIEIAEELEQLGGQDLSFSRKGSGMNDTSYNLVPVAPKKLTKEEEQLELIDPLKFIKQIPYDQQAAFYAGEEPEGGDASAWTD
jgi:hypothetical protein